MGLEGEGLVSQTCLFLDKVTRQVDEGHDLDVICLDFAKAFDKVPHQRLLLENHGIKGNVLKWITSWLSDRKQRVSIRGRCSGWQWVLSGVPQGSVLGPLLILVFINDIDEGLVSDILKFAADTKIFQSVSSERDCLSLQRDLTSLAEWSKRWQMEFNTSKCTVLHISSGNQQFPYELNGQVLSSSKAEKDLGVIITDSLKSSSNCRAAYSKANRVLGMIKRTIIYKSPDILLPLYKTLVRPLVEYCTPAWSPHYSKDKVLLEKIQHRFTRMIPGSVNWIT